VALRVPINYVTVPAVSLRAACFAHNQYEDAAFRDCFLSLIDSEFQKFVVDVFWDAARQTWSLCPVSLDPSAFESAKVVARASGETPFPRLLGRLPEDERPRVWARQESSSSSIPDTLSSPGLTATVSSTGSLQNPRPTSSTATIPRPTDITNGEGQPVYQIGPYYCSSTITFSLLTDILEAELDATDNTTHAFITYFILNVHAAAPFSSPDSPAQQPTSGELPSKDDQLSNVLNGNLSSHLYTPQKLRDERSNLNDSWFEVRSVNQPITAYYQIAEKEDSDDLSTPDGWPTEAYMEFKEFRRVVVGFGSIDPQMSDYDLSLDENVIFSSSMTQELHNSSFKTSGEISSGCFFSKDRTTISDANSSWAVSVAPDVDIALDGDPTTPIAAITNLTSCGISPLLNTTLSNVTADVNDLPYLAFARSTLWSWAPGEPANNTNRSPHLCAEMHRDLYPGRWRTTMCSQKRKVACQDIQKPYQWSLSERAVSYLEGDKECPPNTSFSVPRTALENSHLLSVLQNSPRQSDHEAVFLNINAIDQENCWVTGINGTCPYERMDSLDKDRLVVVPTVAAIIVFVVAALTLFVKCTANRRETLRGRRRRNVAGWDYEGVPS